MGRHGHQHAPALGRAAALAVVALGLAACGSETHQRAQRLAAGDADAKDLAAMCPAAFARGRTVAEAALASGELSPAEPAVLIAGRRPRIQCAFTDRFGRLGAVTADVACADDLEPSCVELVSVLQGDRVRYLRPRSP